MSAEKIGYKQVTGAATVVKATPGGFFGIICVVGGAVIVYDSVDASGNILYSKTLVAGDVVSFGAVGIANKAMFCNAGAGTFNIFFT